MTTEWEQLGDGLHVLQDSCLVYAVRGPEGTVLVNAGTGLAAETLQAVAGNGPVTVLLTHHFRDHTDGAARLAAAGARIVGPYWDQEYLLDPEQHFRERQMWNSYDNRWDRFSPVRPIPVQEWAMDYGAVDAGGLQWTVVPTPGVTNGACSYVVEHGGQRLAFVGEVICGHGRTGRVAPLQYNYNDLLGAQNLFHSATRVLARGPDRMLPSLGDPIDDPAAAVGALRQNILEIRRIQPGFPELRDIDTDDVEQVLPHLYRARYSGAETHFLIADSGKVMCIDYGYHHTVAQFPGKSHPSNRRPLLHSMKGLQKHTGAQSIDAVLVSHFHDDHVNGINMLRRLFGTQVWAADLFADLLEEPMRWDRPCLWHEPIPVDNRLPLHETFEWEGIPITLSPMSGHTRFATLISFEIDGQKVVHTGDQIFYDSDTGGWKPGAHMTTNHVYKNGLDMGCYHAVVDDLERIRPDWVLTGHTPPFQPADEWYGEIRRGAEAFDDVHRKLMILGDDEAHFGAESQGGKIKPYRVHVPEGGEARIDGWILNPLPVAATAEVRLVVPDGWQGSSQTLSVKPREQVNIDLTLCVPAGVTCRRQPIALELVVDGRPFGQVAEALVTAGSERF